jgi:hypothetical protein
MVITYLQLRKRTILMKIVTRARVVLRLVGTKIMAKTRMRKMGRAKICMFACQKFQF